MPPGGGGGGAADSESATQICCILRHTTWAMVLVVKNACDSVVASDWHSVGTILSFHGSHGSNRTPN